MEELISGLPVTGNSAHLYLSSVPKLVNSNAIVNAGEALMQALNVCDEVYGLRVRSAKMKFGFVNLSVFRLRPRAIYFR